MPFDLTEDEIAIVRSAATPLPRICRDAFERAVIDELAHCTEIGPGVIHRACAALQRQFYDPPRLDVRGGSVSKYMR